MLTPHAFTLYPGAHPIDKAKAYLREKHPSYSTFSAQDQQKLAANLVLTEHARRERLFLSGADGANSALEQLKTILQDDESLGQAIRNAFKEDPDGLKRLFEGLAKEVEAETPKKKDEAVAASAKARIKEICQAIEGQPGRNELERVQFYLSSTVPHFKHHHRFQQIVAASKFSRALPGGETAALAAMTSALNGGAR